MGENYSQTQPYLILGTFIYLWNVIRLGLCLLLATYLYVANQSKCVSGILFLKSCNARSCKVMQLYTRSCNVPQDHATSCKVMQSHVIMQDKPHTSLVNFTLLSQRFACIQDFSGSWRGVVVYHRPRWSPESKLVPFIICHLEHYHTLIICVVQVNVRTFISNASYLYSEHFKFISSIVVQIYSH